MNQLRSGTKILVQRGRMGGRDVYAAMLGLREQNSLVPPRPESGALDDREQRLTDTTHAADIARYVAEVDDYFLPGMMALLHAAPEFEPLKDGGGEMLTDRIGWLWVDAAIARSLGDGMHRGIGIEQALAVHGDGHLAEDTILVSFVVEPDRDRRRQLFNDINRTQKRVAKSLGISYDSRDPVAVAINDLLETHPFGVLVEREKPTAGRSSGLLTTTGTLFDAVSILAYGWSAKPGRTSGPVTKEQAADAARLLVDAITSVPDVQEVLDAGNPGEAANRLRERSILGSGATVKAIAGGLFIAQTRLGSQADVREALGKLSELDWAPDAGAWIEVGFVPPNSRTPSSRRQEVRAAAQVIADRLAPEDSR